MEQLEKKNNKLEKLDHRDLNKELEIFFFDEKIGQGLPVLLKNGTTIRNIIQDYLRKKERQYGFEEVISPVLADPVLYEKSGHFAHYRDYIFPFIEKDREKFQLRPMTCPHHCMIFKRKIHSYRELPVWICEHSILHRFESSGSLKGLERVRWMELSDNHIFTTEDQLQSVFRKVFSFVSEVFQKFNIKIDRFVCSLHDSDKGKYHDDEQMWERSEGALINALEDLKIDFVKLKGEAAFYGPKLDMEVRAIDGKNVTFSTIQFDFVLPRKFDLSYVNEKGELETPIIVHYSAIGSYQRFISILLEQTQGKLPFWLAPVQLVLIPLLKDQYKFSEVEKFTNEVFDLLKRSDYRVEIWKDKRLSYRIRKSYQLKIPNYIVIGEKEVESGIVNLFSNHSNSSFEVHKDKLLTVLKKLTDGSDQI